MKNAIIKSIILIVSLCILIITIAYGWIITERTVSQSSVFHNGSAEKLELKLYRGYDYDLNGTLDVLDADEQDELSRFYKDITIVDSLDSVSSIIEASVITYRLVVINHTTDPYMLNPYFYFDLTADDLTTPLINRYKSILFRLKDYTVIHHVGMQNTTTITTVVNKSLCMYSNNEFVARNISLASNETLYFDFTLKASNLMNIDTDLQAYNTYSKNRPYDLSKGLYSLNNNSMSLYNGTFTYNDTEYTVTNGISSGSVYLNDIVCTTDLYTYEYNELDKVYDTRQDANAENLTFTLNKVCVDVKAITGNEINVLNDFSSEDLTNYTYGNNLNTFYDSDNVAIVSTYNLANGLFDENGVKITSLKRTIDSVNYIYTLIYEENKIVKVIIEEATE